MITIIKDEVYPMPLSDKDKAVVEAIYAYVNNGTGISPIKVGKELTQIHRALHSTVLKLFIGLCRQMAVDYYQGRCDERNRTVSREIADIYDFMVSNKIVNDPAYTSDTL